MCAQFFYMCTSFKHTDPQHVFSVCETSVYSVCIVVCTVSHQVDNVFEYCNMLEIDVHAMNRTCREDELHSATHILQTKHCNNAMEKSAVK